jgi:uroporphyrinogen-III synthase
VTQPLAGLVVVVTRPARQAARFIGMLEELGATTVAFPTVIIEPVPLDDGVRAALAAQPADWVVYTSANAVEQALAQAGRLPQAATAVIGRATARAVAAAGIRVDAIPETGADSEGLLALPAFAAPSGQHIVVFKGVGGRDALRAELVRRGATVIVAEVYRRRPAVPAGGSLERLASACTTPALVIAATSVEVLESLLQLVPESRTPRLKDATLLVPGERVAEAARRHGWRGAIVAARSAEDEAMLAALIGQRAVGGSSTPA